MIEISHKQKLLERIIIWKWCMLFQMFFWSQGEYECVATSQGEYECVALILYNNTSSNVCIHN